MLSRIAQHLPHLRRELRRRRRLLAGLLACLLISSVLPAVARAVGPGEPVTVAATDLPVGTEITAEHLATVMLPPSSLRGDPPLPEDELLGRTLTSPVAEGAWLRNSDLGSGDDRIPAGSAAVSVPADAALAELLSPGDTVSVTISTTDSLSGQTISGSVLAVPASESGTFTSNDEMSIVVLTIPEKHVADLARARYEGWVHVALMH